MNDERSWFWNAGYADAANGEMMDVPIEAQHQRQRDDYFAGYDAGGDEPSQKNFTPRPETPNYFTREEVLPDASRITEEDDDELRPPT